ncbi:hypothetical protein DM558_00520 [Entomomonas moraniae]|uniref:Uncharacterized protein n=1 Tax=Entomomonas moraniae TaxID=2213226 RepID=A0A3Q9JH52_9GAMM|nr:hypothetical protein [Entomomonas moraniae]AZS49352.1 hypothetical protein DM558_00520 [Entomomonas moraniae]
MAIGYFHYKLSFGQTEKQYYISQKAHHPQHKGDNSYDHAKNLALDHYVENFGAGIARGEIVANLVGRNQAIPGKGTYIQLD